MMMTMWIMMVDNVLVADERLTKGLRLLFYSADVAVHTISL